MLFSASSFYLLASYASNIVFKNLLHCESSLRDILFCYEISNQYFSCNTSFHSAHFVYVNLTSTVERRQGVKIWSSLIYVSELKAPSNTNTVFWKKKSFPVCCLFCTEWAIIRLCKTINMCKGVTDLCYMSWFCFNFPQIAQSCKYSRQLFLF